MSGTPSKRWIGVGRVVALLVALCPWWINSSTPSIMAADAPAPQTAPINPECIEAIKSLKKLTRPSDKEAREKVYDLVARKGDYRLIPVIKAYKDGFLLLQDDHLATLGERVTSVENGQKVTRQPVIDLLTGQQLKGSDGQPLFMERIRGAIAASYKERSVVEELLSVMRLLDPDAKTRITSIREVTERCARAFIDVSEQQRFTDALKNARAALETDKLPDNFTPQVNAAEAAINAALQEKPAKPIDTIPGKALSDSAISAIKSLRQSIDPSFKDSDTDPPRPGTLSSPTSAQSHLMDVLHAFWNAGRDYGDRLEAQEKVLSVLPRYAAVVHTQAETAGKTPFAESLSEAVAGTDAVLGDHATQVKAATTLGDIGTSRANNILQRLLDSAHQAGDADLEKAAEPALAKAHHRQSMVTLVQNSFFGLSAGSILVLLALGLSIVFGLMGVINMAHGEFMMIGAFTTYVVSQQFKAHLPSLFDYYLLAAIPAAFIVSGLCGLLCEKLVIRHLYGRPLETLLATFGVGLIIIWCVRRIFGDSVSVTPPRWMEGDIEIVPDLNLQLNRIYIIVYCLICICVVYFIVNRTKLGLLLRATTQNRDMASALGVATRRIDGVTFAMGAGLAGLAGVAVPLYNKINPQVGQEYIVDSFMVVVVGGVGKLAGAIWAGMGLGFITKYLEPILQNIKSVASGASVFGRVIVLAIIVVFLQYRPSGLFPPKGRNVDA